jgi:hypothetical protein
MNLLASSILMKGLLKSTSSSFSVHNKRMANFISQSSRQFSYLQHAAMRFQQVDAQKAEN